MRKMVMAIWKEFIRKKKYGNGLKEKKGLMDEEIRIGEKRCKIVGIYVNRDMEVKTEELEVV